MATKKNKETKASASGGVPAAQVGEVVQGYVDDGVSQVTVTRLDDGTYEVSRQS